MSKLAYQEKYFAEWIKSSGAGEVPSLRDPLVPTALSY